MCMDRTFEPETSVQHVMRVPAGISRSSRSANQPSPEPASRTVTGLGARVPEDCPEEAEPRHLPRMASKGLGGFFREIHSMGPLGARISAEIYPSTRQRTFAHDAWHTPGAWSGRPGQSPTRGSHGSGRARLTHPALQIMGSLHDDSWSGRRWLRGADSVPRADESVARTSATVRLGDSTTSATGCALRSGTA